MTYTDKSRELLELVENKNSLEKQLTETNKQIALVESELMTEMVFAEISEFTDSVTGKAFKIQEGFDAKQTDFAKVNAEEVAEIFARNGYNIYKTAVHAGTFSSTVKKEVVSVDKETQEVTVPEWARDFVEIKKFRKIKIS